MKGFHIASVLSALFLTLANGALAAPVFVSATGAATEVEAVWLDAGACDGAGRVITASVCFPWQNTTSAPESGLLADNETLRTRFEAAGVSPSAPVIVYGEWLDGWGDEARVWWTLRYLGHERVFIVAGGIDALRAANVSATSNPAPPGHWPPVREAYRTRLVDLDVSGAERVLIDTRTLEEYRGAVLWNERRGGRIEGAVHLDWRELATSDGLRSEDELRAVFSALGAGGNSELVAYCTGGVRSAFVVAVLEELGHRASNYDGSWWEYAAEVNTSTAAP